MDQTNNPNNPGENPQPPPFEGAPPPPAFGDPEPPAYGDPMTPPPPPDPSPLSPPPGLPPAHSSAPNPPIFSATEPPRAAPSLTSPTPDERNWALFAHLSAIAARVVLMFTTIPAFGFVGPLVIYLMKKDESPFVADQAKEALNFHITIGIVLFAMWFLALILVWTIIVPFLMIALTGLVGLVALVLTIIAAVKASNGEAYRYPFTLRLIK